MSLYLALLFQILYGCCVYWTIVYSYPHHPSDERLMSDNQRKNDENYHNPHYNPIQIDSDYLLAIQRASSIYVSSSLLSAVQSLSIYNDSKTFVDMPMRYDPDYITQQWNQLSSIDQSNKTVVEEFLSAYFDEFGTDITEAIPDDINDDLKWFQSIKNASYRTWAKSLNTMWKELGRATADDVLVNPQRYSTLIRRNLYIIPGGRFRESYYWDSYWIILGLLACDAHDTVQGMLMNYFDDIDLFGFIPNGGRIYYLNRSQPPLLSEMVLAWVHHVRDDIFKDNFIEYALKRLEIEYEYWMTTHAVSLNDPNGQRIDLTESITLNKYYTNITIPRSESYREDISSCNGLYEDYLFYCYSNIAASAESGWDFSGRWFGNSSSTGDEYDMKDLSTTAIIPVDLNSFMLRMEQNIAILHQILSLKTPLYQLLDEPYEVSFQSVSRRAVINILKQSSNPATRKYYLKSERRAKGMMKYLFNSRTGRWQDYWLDSSYNVHNKLPRLDVTVAYKVSEYTPVWAGILDYDLDVLKPKAAFILKSIKNSNLLQDFGVQTTTIPHSVTGQQWDEPNAWAPLQLIMIEALQTLETEVIKEEQISATISKELVSSWLSSNYQGWADSGLMYEKYNSQVSGVRGDGGEYPPQTGFGWTNGVVLHLLRYYHI